MRRTKAARRRRRTRPKDSKPAAGRLAAASAGTAYSTSGSAPAREIAVWSAAGEDVTISMSAAASPGPSGNRRKYSAAGSVSASSRTGSRSSAESSASAAPPREDNASAAPAPTLALGPSSARPPRSHPGSMPGLRAASAAAGIHSTKAVGATAPPAKLASPNPRGPRCAAVIGAASALPPIPAPKTAAPSKHPPRVILPVPRSRCSSLPREARPRCEGLLRRTCLPTRPSGYIRQRVPHRRVII